MHGGQGIQHKVMCATYLVGAARAARCSQHYMAGGCEWRATGVKYNSLCPGRGCEVLSLSTRM